MKCPSINESGLLLHLDASRRESMAGTPELWGASAWSQSGMTGYTASRVNNGLTDLGDNCLDASTAGIGSYLRLDTTNGRAFTQVKWYNSPNTHSHGVYSVQYSDNGSDWSNAATGFDVGSNGMVACTWASVGAHRYWQLYKTDAAVAGNYCYEVQFLDATWKDLSGNGYHATLYGATYSQLNGGCMVFDGSTAYGQTTETSFTGNSSYTLMMWVKSTQIAVNRSYMLLTALNSGMPSQGIWIAGSVSLPEIDAGIVTSTSSFSGGLNVPYPYGWTFITSVRDGTTLRNYANASAKTPIALTGTVTDDYNYFIFGRRVSAYYWPGSIAQILVYQRALSAAEILQNYNATKGRFGL